MKLNLYALCAGLCLSAAYPLSATETNIATFEDLDLAPESHWCGELPEDEDQVYTRSTFRSGQYEFNNIFMPAYDSWSFFSYSNHTSNTYSSYATDQWNSAAGGGAQGSSNFGVMYYAPFMGYALMHFPEAESGLEIPGMYVCCSAWTVDAILHGDGMEGPFGKGDFLNLVLVGRLDGEDVSKLEIPLADYSSDNEDDWWYYNEWNWVDLSSLGKVDEVEWQMTSSKANDYGITTPTYVCFDNLGAENPELGVESIQADSFSLQVYPNPANEYAYINTCSECGACQVFVYAYDGKLVGRFEGKRIETSTLADGIYLVQVQDDSKGVATTRLIVRH